MSLERTVALVVWLGLLAVSVGFAPAAAPDTNEVIVKMLTGQVSQVNTSLFALFNQMGVYPMAFLAVLAFDSTQQRVPKWPFVLGSFGLGAFVLVPYLVVRTWNLLRRPATSVALKVLGSRALGGVLSLLAVTLVGLFLVGDVRRFGELFATQQFPFVMSLDFVACWLSGALLGREEARLNTQPVLFWLSLIPAVGLPLVLLARRRSVR